MTVASGNGLLVAEVGKKMPVAVFYQTHQQGYALVDVCTHSLRLEPLDQDTVKEGNKSLDRLESRLSSLVRTENQFRCLWYPMNANVHH